MRSGHRKALPMLTLNEGSEDPHPRDRSSERGDVPGWVLITVMSAGLVAALWAVAGPELTQMLREALNSVR